MVAHRRGAHGRGAHQERRGPGGAGEGRHAGRRQDRHAHRGQAPPGRRSSAGAQGSTRPSCSASRRASSAGSEHPLAAAIVAGAEERGLALPPGRGLSLGHRQGRERDGRRAQRRRSATGASWMTWRLAVGRSRRAGGGAPRRGADGHVRGRRRPRRRAARRRRSRSRPSTPEALRPLHADGLRVVMLTGDSRTTAEAVARQLGIDEVRPRCCPSRRREVIKRLQAEGRVVAMAGDGINDAPGAGPGRRRHRHGHRHRRGHGERRASRWSRATCAGSCGPGAEPGDDGQHPAEPSSRSSTTRSACPSRRGALPVLRTAAQPDGRQRGDEPELGVRHRQRPPPPPRAARRGGRGRDTPVSAVRIQTRPVPGTRRRRRARRGRYQPSRPRGSRGAPRLCRGATSAGAWGPVRGPHVNILGLPAGLGGGRAGVPGQARQLVETQDALRRWLPMTHVG